MKSVVIGLGNQGGKRKKVAGSDIIATVDPLNPEADYKTIQEVDSTSYDSALLCCPDQNKIEIIEYLIEQGKHFLVEKPVIHESSDIIRDLMNKAKAKNLVAYTAYNHRFEPHIVRAKEAIESGLLGEIYTLRMFYGNGTARDVRNSNWKDQGMSVWADLGSHLLDTLLFLFENRKFQFEKIKLSNFENKAPDHFFLQGFDKMAIHLEGTLLSWRNSFYLDVRGEKGSLHIDCLCKWGPSIYTLRERVLPSGRPPEESITLIQEDPTWQLEYDYFVNLCQQKREGNFENDIYINDTLNTFFQG